MILYGNATLEEQVQDKLSMWLWAAVAFAVFIVATAWLNRHLKKQESV